jgi:AcrR family transcriptional regulator
MSTRAVRSPRARANGEGADGADHVSPLASVVSALKRAGARGELSDIEIEWSVARLSGKVRRGNPRLDGVDRPDDILRTATQVFRRNGYHHATIDDIANELFLTKAGVYHYFASKQEILEAICDRAMTAAEEAVASGLAEETEPYPRLRLALERYAEALMGQEGLPILLLHVDEISEKGQADIKRRRKDLEASLRRVVEEGIRTGVFQTDDAQVAVYGMLGAMNWMYSWYVPGGRLPAAKVRDTLVQQSILGVLARVQKEQPKASPTRPAAARRR